MSDWARVGAVLVAAAGVGTLGAGVLAPVLGMRTAGETLVVGVVLTLLGLWIWAQSLRAATSGKAFVGDATFAGAVGAQAPAHAADAAPHAADASARAAEASAHAVDASAHRAYSRGPHDRGPGHGEPGLLTEERGSALGAGSHARRAVWGRWRFLVPAGIVVALVATTGTLVAQAGGVDRFAESVREASARASGEVHGLWASTLLDTELAALAPFAAGRDVASIHIFEEAISLSLVSETDAAGVDSYRIRRGAITGPVFESALSYQLPFAFDAVDTSVIRNTLAGDYEGASDVNITAVSIDNLETTGLRISVEIEERYGTTSPSFDARTGMLIDDD